MAIYAPEKLAASWYTPENQESEEVKTEFRLKPLSEDRYLDVMMEAGETQGGDLKLTGTGIRIALKYGLVDWKNFLRKSDDKAIKFKATKINLIPAPIQAELAGEIINRSSTDEEDEKKS